MEPDDSAVASSNDRRIPLVVLGVACVVLVLSFIGFYTSDAARKGRERDARLAEAQGQTRQPGRTLPTVEIFRARSESAADWIELSGLLEPIRSTWVAAEIAGRIVEVAAQEHAVVPRNALLVQLDPALPQAEVIRAEANHRLAELELERQEKLGSRSVASEAERDRAVAEERGSYAALLEARKRLDQTRIRAPFAGVVNSLDLDPGAYVAPGTRIAEVLDVATLEIEVEVNDRQVGAIHAGDEARLRIDPLGNDVVVGRVARVARAPHPETQRYPVIVALENSEGRMLPGMLARVELEVGRSEAIRVPARAVVREFELDYVFAVIPNGSRTGTVERVRVQTRPVPFRRDWVEIRGGLDGHDWVATSGIDQLRSGDSVRLVREPSS